MYSFLFFPFVWYLLLFFKFGMFQNLKENKEEQKPVATWLNSRYLKCSVSQAEMIILPICSFSDSQFWWMVFLSEHLLKVENLEIILTVSSLAPISKLYSASEISLNFNPSFPPPLLLLWPLPWPLTSPTNLPASSLSALQSCWQLPY